MRVVTLTCPGQAQNHLLSRIASEHQLVGAVWMSGPGQGLSMRLRTGLERSIHPLKLAQHFLAKKINRTRDADAEALRERFGFKPLSIDSVPQLHVHDVNHAAAIEFAFSLSPDIVLVNGTNLLREPWLDRAKQIPNGIINIHTGLSPYSRGGNCNLFCILHGQLQCVGVTLHYIDSGIDSGDIIYTARPRVQLDDTFERIEVKVFRLGEDLASLALRQIDGGLKLERVKQWTTGKEFLKRTGYSYHPYQRLIANDKLSSGLLECYLNHKRSIDETATVIEPTLPIESWRSPYV